MALHELRAPLTTVAYAAELLLDSPRPSLTPATQRRHLESIHQSAADASSLLTLFSRFIEVEHAGEFPKPETLSAEAFRDPRATTPGPEELTSHALVADQRLVRHLVKTLWELADLHPAPRPVLCALVPQPRQLTLVFEATGPLYSLLVPSAPQKPAPRRGRRTSASPQLPFTLAFRLDIFSRALRHLGGILSPVLTGAPTRFQIILPSHRMSPSVSLPEA